MENQLAARQYSEIAPIIFPNLKSLKEKHMCCGLVDGFKQIGPELGMTSRLRDVGVTCDDLPLLATDAMKQTRLLVNNPREMTYDAALGIYSKAL